MAKRLQNPLPHLAAVAALLLTALLSGCGKGEINQALDSDANGFVCQACKTKFYTERKLFADFCPNCKNGDVRQVVGFVCSHDGHVTLAPRGPGFLACEKCGKSTSALSIPREKDLQAWGAARKSAGEVSSQPN
ncbi:MAG: hypothetical protein KIS67_02580 [Verrucomicrobiae bacterium]|nr:hypothetical protein [Verrucomicrobiae bacterium]